MCASADRADDPGSESVSIDRPAAPASQQFSSIQQIIRQLESISTGSSGSSSSSGGGASVASRHQRSADAGAVHSLQIPANATAATALNDSDCSETTSTSPSPLDVNFDHFFQFSHYYSINQSSGFIALNHVIHIQ